MDLMMTAAAVGSTACGCLLSLGHRWITLRAQIRRAEIDQQGLSERTRSLPPGSRLVEKSVQRNIDIVIGGAAADQLAR